MRRRHSPNHDAITPAQEPGACLFDRGVPHRFTTSVLVDEAREALNR